jgi:hypothetical protein
MTTSKATIGFIVESAGFAAIAVGAVLSLHHAAIAVCLVAGGAAAYAGKRIRAAAG